MAKLELVIDIGSKNITVLKKDSGIVLKEPTIVVAESNRNKADFVAWGRNAKSRLTKAENLQIVYPIKGGAIAHENGAVYMFKEIFSGLMSDKPFFKPRISVFACVSSGLTNAEKADVEDVLHRAGASDVTVVESPIAVSHNRADTASLLVDIGASKSEVSVMSQNGIEAGCSVDIGGDEMNRLISDYITDRYRIAVQGHNIEKLKTSIASMFDNDASIASVSGRNIIDGKPKTVRISAGELMTAIQPAIDKIAEVIETVTFMIPNAYAEEIFNNGIYLSGGGSLISGLDTYLQNKLLIKVTRLDDPENAVINGGAAFFYTKDRLANMLNIKNLK